MQLPISYVCHHEYPNTVVISTDILHAYWTLLDPIGSNIPPGQWYQQRDRNEGDFFEQHEQLRVNGFAGFVRSTLNTAAI